MSVIIVAGPTCSGKSTFIQKNFPHHKVIDVYDFQKDFRYICIDNVMESYIQCKDALVAAIKESENVVLEHTLLKAKRRAMYVEAIKEVTDDPIEMYFLLPSDKQLLKQMKKRKYSKSLVEAQKMRELAELPTISEGYSVVHIISDNPTENTVEYT